MNKLFQIQKELLYYRHARIERNKGLYEKPVAAPFQPKTVSYSIPSTPTNNLSEPFFSTGEHVLTGEEHDSLLQNFDLEVNGVPFKYSEIIAMGDLFDTNDDMMKASVSHLQGLQRLIQRSREYDAARLVNSSSGVKKPTDDEWQTATSGRYLKLAEENYSHFAPSNILISGFTSTKKNHKTEWETYHQKAIEHARKSMDNVTFAEALVINAFGDHFLTDAFAGGHLFNKDDINQYFKTRIFTGGTLNSAAHKFLEQVAGESFVGKVKETFSKHQITSRDLDKGFIKWNIDNTDVFRKLLVHIMGKEPDIFGKSVVALAVHDILNDPKKRPKALRVRNNKGDKWDIVGDGSMELENLKRARMAVAQSIQNIHDSVFRDNTAPVHIFFQRVWDFVPQPETAAIAEIKRFIQLYTDPAHWGLVLKTAKMIKEHYQEILSELVKRKYLEVDD